jgi:hypothetical protein
MKGTQRTYSTDLSNKGHRPRYTLMTSDTDVTKKKRASTRNEHLVTASESQTPFT